MTGRKECLMNFVKMKCGKMIFGDGVKADVIGYGDLNEPCLPCLTKVYLVKGLTSNLNFTKSNCLVYNQNDQLIMEGTRTSSNCYLLKREDHRINLAKEDLLRVWHDKLGHINSQLLVKVSKLGAVRGLPNLTKTDPQVCPECTKGKQVKAIHKKLEQPSTTTCLQLLYMDLMGPTEVTSIGGKRYIFECVDDFSRYSWVYFLKEKSEACNVFLELSKQLMTESSHKIIRVRSDYGKEFDNKLIDDFCIDNGIRHEFSAPKTPQQNGVVERKNRTLQEMARTMLHACNIPKRF